LIGAAIAVKILIGTEIIDPKNRALLTPLMLAVSRAKHDVVECLLDYCRAQNMYSSKYQTVPTQELKKMVIKFLIGTGAILDPRNRDQLTPLMLAASRGKQEVAECLLDCGAALNMCTDGHQTALTQALKNGHDNVVRVLLERGARIDFPKTHQTTRAGLEVLFHNHPIFLAALFGNPDAILELLTADIDGTTL
jgi:ankyrin repeat protein